MNGLTLVLTRPLLHLNGSSAEALQAGYLEAAKAVRDALRLVSQTAPNARDYYPHGTEAIRAATAEHEARMKALTSVEEQLLTLSESVADQVDERNRHIATVGGAR